MIQKLVSVVTATIAKDKGFPQWGDPLFSMYHFSSTPLVAYIDGSTQSYWFNTEGKNRIAVRPTQCLLQNWLREKHKIDVIVIPNPKISGEYTCTIYNQWTETDRYTERKPKITHLTSNKSKIVWTVYEKALEEGLKVALGMIKS